MFFAMVTGISKTPGTLISFADLDNSFFGAGACAQTTLWTVNVIIYQIDEKPTFDIFVDSTMARFLWQWLDYSSKEFVYE